MSTEEYDTHLRLAVIIVILKIPRACAYCVTVRLTPRRPRSARVVRRARAAVCLSVYKAFSPGSGDPALLWSSLGCDSASEEDEESESCIVDFSFRRRSICPA